VIEAKDDNDDLFFESADLLFHYSCFTSSQDQIE
jgi:phosphoribosyl-ATP pyrophosphohydrolase